jgi:limonene-1,2-epoxide hydrolase
MDVIDRFCTVYSDLCQATPEDLASIYSNDVVFIDPIKAHRGLADVKSYFANLLDQAQRCHFDITTIIATQPSQSTNITHVVNWTMYLKVKKHPSEITLKGTTQLSVFNDRIAYHRDYYDLGQMVYEHIPILRFFIKKIKARMAQ